MTKVIDKTATLAKIILELQYRNAECLPLAEEFKVCSWEELCDHGIKLLSELKEIHS